MTLLSPEVLYRERIGGRRWAQNLSRKALPPLYAWSDQLVPGFQKDQKGQRVIRQRLIAGGVLPGLERKIELIAHGPPKWTEVAPRLLACCYPLSPALHENRFRYSPGDDWSRTRNHQSQTRSVRSNPRYPHYPKLEVL